MDDFCIAMADILEVDSVSAETRFREVGEFDSLKGFAMIVTLERDYGKKMSVPEFLNCETIQDLASVAGVV